jgi:hypothetical protein
MATNMTAHRMKNDCHWPIISHVTFICEFYFLFIYQYKIIYQYY